MAADAQRLGCAAMGTFIHRLAATGTGDRLAAKDLIDMAGLPTSAGCRAVADGAAPATPDATSLDTIGPMARDVAGVVKGMQLLEPGFEVARSAPSVVGRFRHPDVHPEIDLAVDRALAGVGCEVQDVELSGWDGAFGAGGGII